MLVFFYKFWPNGAGVPPAFWITQKMTMILMISGQMLLLWMSKWHKPLYLGNHSCENACIWIIGILQCLWSEHKFSMLVHWEVISNATCLQFYNNLGWSDMKPRVDIATLTTRLKVEFSGWPRVNLITCNQLKNILWSYVKDNLCLWLMKD